MRRYAFPAIIIVLTALLGLIMTGCGGDTSAPTVSDVAITNITDSSATVTWTTSEPATSQLQYGTDNGYHTTTPLSVVLKTTHSIEIDKLASETAYHFYVKSKDAADNLAVSNDATFNTTVDTTPNRIAIIETSKGTIKIELYENRAPITTANFIALAQDEFYTDDMIFHRVIDNFVIQTGDPLNTGVGGSNDYIVLETHPELLHTNGAVGMARGESPNSASSQFYICDGSQSLLDGSYAVFAQVIEGIEVVSEIAAVPTDPDNDEPITEIALISVTIE